jgi:hypothetical protein
LYERVLADLASIDFAATLVWARYHEPLAHESIHANLVKARKALPRAFLTMHTNGDYLVNDILERVTQEGLNQLRINLYVPNGQTYTKEAVAKMITSLEQRTGHRVEQDAAGGILLGHRRLHMPINVPDFYRSMSSRGGALAKECGAVELVRTSVCLSPLQHVVIDYNGKGMLCCQVRSDVPKHQSAIIGDLGQAGYSVFDLYRDLAAARRGLMAPGRKSGVCTTCTMNGGGPYRFGRSRLLNRLVSAVPGEQAVVSALWERRPRRFDPE